MKKREKPAERFAVAYEQQRLTKSFEILVDRSEEHTSELQSPA